MEYLYHYTSLDTLALILSNKTICFNNLLYVDDIEEARTQDMGLFGRFKYVSCWTADSEESIPLWNMYTPNMHGVRIRLPKYPSKKYYYKKGDFHLSKDEETYINFKKFYLDNKASIVLSDPQLVKVDYTDEYHKLFPQVRKESYPGAVRDFLQAKKLEDLKGKNINVSYDHKKLGRFKRENWEFQKEWRYIITLNPIGLQEVFYSDFECQQKLIRMVEDRELEPPYKKIFLDLDENFFVHMEIVFGPKMSEAEKIMAKALLKYFCPNCPYRESTLQIRKIP